MTKYFYDAPVFHEGDLPRLEQSEPCDTCGVVNCEFAPNGADCINRRSILANSDLRNYDRECDHHAELTEERLKSERDYYNKEKGIW